MLQQGMTAIVWFGTDSKANLPSSWNPPTVNLECSSSSKSTFMSISHRTRFYTLLAETKTKYVRVTSRVEESSRQTRQRGKTRTKGPFQRLNYLQLNDWKRMKSIDPKPIRKRRWDKWFERERGTSVKLFRERLLWERLCCGSGCEWKPSSCFFMRRLFWYGNYGRIPQWSRTFQYNIYVVLEFSLMCQRCHSPINIKVKDLRWAMM